MALFHPIKTMRGGTDELTNHFPDPATADDGFWEDLEKEDTKEKERRVAYNKARRDKIENHDKAFKEAFKRADPNKDPGHQRDRKSIRMGDVTASVAHKVEDRENDMKGLKRKHESKVQREKGKDEFKPKGSAVSS